MEKPTRYWFPAKKYGWGWGLPDMWQGWLVLLAYLAGIIFIFLRMPPGVQPNGFAVSVIALSIILVVICWWKGEPPRWRWGGK